MDTAGIIGLAAPERGIFNMCKVPSPRAKSLREGSGRVCREPAQPSYVTKEKHNVSIN